MSRHDNAMSILGQPQARRHRRRSRAPTANSAKRDSRRNKRTRALQDVTQHQMINSSRPLRSTHHRLKKSLHKDRRHHAKRSRKKCDDDDDDDDDEDCFGWPPDALRPPRYCWTVRAGWHPVSIAVVVLLLCLVILLGVLPAILFITLLAYLFFQFYL